MGALLLAACSSAGTGGADGFDGAGTKCNTGADCPTDMCVISVDNSYCTRECATHADCPSNMFCLMQYAAVTPVCDLNDNVVLDCTSQCEVYHDLQCTTADVSANCSRACSMVTAEQAKAFLQCAAPEATDSHCGTSCIDTLCSQANIACQ